MIQFLRSIVGKLWLTIIGLVIIVLAILGMFLLEYIEMTFTDSAPIKNLFIITGVIGFSMTTLFALFLSSRITRPLIQLKEAAEHVARGNYNMRIVHASSDELGELANTFNNMAEQLQRLFDALKHEKEHLSSILSSMSDAVVTFDANGNVILTNPKGSELMEAWKNVGLDGDTTPSAASDLQSGGTVPKPLLALFESIVSGSDERVTKLNVLNTVWSVVVTPLYSGDHLRGAVAVLRDVTEEHRLDKLRNDFLANVSHELRTPISMVQGYSEALLDDIAASPEEQRQLVQIIHEESLRMGRLVKDLMDLAKMQSGHLEMHYARLVIQELLHRFERKYSPIARDRGIELEFAMPDQPLVMNRADEGRLEQVLTNLLDNAIRHTPSGKRIRVIAELTSLDGASWIRLEVADEGEGIPEHDLPYIFERFYKADKARTRGQTGGTGLGLAIVKHFVDAHGGQINVRSKLGEGTTFTICLPTQ
jgi:two-component system sensor histidine kinase ResE